MNVNTYFNNPQKFLSDLFVPTGSGPKRFGSCMAEFQRDRFAGIAPALLALSRGEMPEFRRHFWCATKGASKDSDLACCLLWLLFASRRPLRIQIGAGDFQQADEIRLIFKQLLRLEGPLNRMLGTMIEVQADRIINTKTESVAEICTTDATGSHGSRPDVVIVNELSHLGSREFAETMLDNADKVPRSLVIIASNAGFVGSWQHDWFQNALSSVLWKVHQYNQPAPWISATDIEESRKRNSNSRFMRLWFGRWVSNSGDALDADVIDAAITLAGPLLAPRPGFLYVAGVDLGIKRDASAICVIGKAVGQWQDGEKAEPVQKTSVRRILEDLDLADETADEIFNEGSWIAGDNSVHCASLSLFLPNANHGKAVSLSDVESEILALHRVFQFASVGIDPWQAALLIERLNTAGLQTAGVDFTSANLRGMAQEVLDSFNERRISLYPDPVLLADLKALRVRETGHGFRLDSERGKTEGGTAHGDSATALSIALLVAKRIEHYGPAASGEPLVCWP